MTQEQLSSFARKYRLNAVYVCAWAIAAFGVAYFSPITPGYPSILLNAVLAAIFTAASMTYGFAIWQSIEDVRLRTLSLRLLSIASLLILIVMVMSALTYDIPDGFKVVGGFLFRPEIQSLSTDQAMSPRELLEGAEYDPLRIWVPWSVFVVRALLLTTWLGAHSAVTLVVTKLLLVYGGAHHPEQRRVLRHEVDVQEPLEERLRLPAVGHNNLWYNHANTNTVIIFIHGIFSDSRTSWLHSDPSNTSKPVYWPNLLENDGRLSGASIYLSGFYTAVDAGIYDLRCCVNEVSSAIERADASGRKPVIEMDNLIFVCHSTGGIVARYLLESRAQRFQDKKIGLVLIASPSFGSKLADRLDLLARLYNQRLGMQLQWGNWSLEDLDDRFRTLIYERRIPDLHGVEAYENHFIYHRKWLPDRHVLVTKESAGRYFGAPVCLRNTDHFSAVKPSGLDHPAHQLLVNFCLREFPEVFTVTPTTDGQNAPE